MSTATLIFACIGLGGLVAYLLIKVRDRRHQIDKLQGGNGKEKSSSSLQYEGNISIEAKECTKASFFENSSLVLYFWDDFTDWILSILPDVIPAFSGTIAYHSLKKDMYDSEIQKESGNKTPFSILEFFAIIIFLIMKQPKGEVGTLLNNGYANIFYVNIGSSVVAVGVYRGDARWYFGAALFGNSRCSTGNRFFSRD